MSVEPVVVAFLGGLVTSASPCAIGAAPVAIAFVGGQRVGAARAWLLSSAFVTGGVLAISLLGLGAARAGLFVATASPAWAWAVGLVLVAAGLWIGCSTPVGRGRSWWGAIYGRLPLAGVPGALLLGALLGTVASPCATPALVMALSLAAQGAGQEGTVLAGALPLFAYAVGHSALLLVAGALPGLAQSALRRIDRVDVWLPGRRSFAALMSLSGAWWILQAGLP